jgi:hypothetical protein
VTDAGSLLTASAVLLAVTGLLFTLWYPEVSLLLRSKPPVNMEERRRRIGPIRDAYRMKAVPLAILALAQLAIFLPEVVRVAVHATETVVRDGAAAFSRYDSIQTAFIATYAGLAFVATNAIALARGLRHQVHEWERGSDDSH